MSDKRWTRETLTEQILKDAAGLWKHIETEESFPRDGLRLMDAVKGGCADLLQGKLGDTRDLLTLAVCMLHALREITLEAEGKRGRS